MKIAQLKWENSRWTMVSGSDVKAGLCLVFGSRPVMEASPEFYQSLRSLFPVADIVTVSTAGNIMDELLLDETIIATCVEFETTRIRTTAFELGKKDDRTLGKEIAGSFDTKDLAQVLLFSCAGINAGNILSGINAVFKGEVPVSGGVAGDDTRFKRTLVGLNGSQSDTQLVAVAMYSANLKVSHGSKGGWDTFGPRRKVTKSRGNVLYEIDNRSAVELYKEYLGDKASELPGSALLFPFAITDPETGSQIVRGIQSLDEDEKAIVLFGDVEEGETLQLMRSNFERLIDGAADSARETFLERTQPPQLALLISCVARRLVLGQLTEEELSASKSVLGPSTAICGFYSYSELSPIVGDNACHLHNQTMTITTFAE